MKIMKRTKLLREIDEIMNSGMVFWAKAKALTLLNIGSRPGCDDARSEINNFLETGCEYPDRFRTAYVRPYLSDRYGLDDVSGGPAAIGREPRGIVISKSSRSNYWERNKWGKVDKFFRQYPIAFDEEEEIINGERESVYAWSAVIGMKSRGTYRDLEMEFWKIERKKYLRRIPSGIQKRIHNLDLRMTQAAKDYKKLKKQSGLPPKYLYNEVGLGELHGERSMHSYSIFNGHYVTVETKIEFEPTNRYNSISHRVTGRKVIIRKGTDEYYEKRLQSYSGHFLIKTLCNFFKIKKQKFNVSTELKPVQLNTMFHVSSVPWDDIKDSLEKRGITPEVVEKIKQMSLSWWERRFYGHHYDYCVLKDGITFHATDFVSCIRGWDKKSKIVAASKIASDKVLQFEDVVKLGFCKTGIESFCSENGLDIDASYTVGEIMEVVEKKKELNLRYYANELRIIGIIL